MTLMDLITSVPMPIPLSAPPPPSPSSASPAVLPPPSSGIGKLVTTDRKSKRGTLSQIQSDTISAAKAALNPVRINILPQKRKQKKKGAAVAYVADLFKVPAIFMKAMTDIVDGDKPISEEYLQNVSVVTAALG